MTALRRPVLLAAWAAAVLLVGVVAAVRHDDRSVATSAKATTTTTAPGSGPAGSVPGATGTTAAGGADGTSAGATTVTLPGDDGATGVDGGASTTAPARTMPQPGTYTETNSGTASFNGAPQQVPAQSQFIIEQLSDTDQRFTSPSPSGDMVAQLRYTPTEVDLVSLKFGPKQFQPNPPVTFAPTTAPPDTTWSWSAVSTDGKTTLAAQGRVKGSEVVTVAGQGVDTVIIELDFTLSGDITGTIQLTTWARPSDRLPVRQHTVVDASGLSPVPFHITSDTTSQLVALTPN